MCVLRGLNFLEHVLKKLENRLSMWRCILLSTSGRAQLITSVLNNLLIHFLSLFRIPDFIARKIVSLERKFYWGSCEEKKALMTVNLESLEAPRSLGGLEFGIIHIGNLGLLTKWWWKYSKEPNVL